MGPAYGVTGSLIVEQSGLPQVAGLAERIR
jgi:hypothetical protein